MIETICKLPFHLKPTGRTAKSTKSVVEKLRRESIRLSQMQDVVGCRVIVDDFREQTKVALSVAALFEESTMVDRRLNPSHGYRAVHLIVLANGKLVEIQIRTKLQHLWAELSEKLSDIEGIEVKYGGGPDRIQKRLSTISVVIEAVEETGQRLYEIMHVLPAKGLPDSLKSEIDRLQHSLEEHKQLLTASIRDMIAQCRK